MQDSAPKALRLYLLRHARSGWALPGQRDFDRSLDEVGYIDAERLAQTAADQGIRPDRILCSTAVRCRETAEPFFRTFTTSFNALLRDGQTATHVAATDSVSGESVRIEVGITVVR